MDQSDTRPRIVHVLDRLSVGGMETVAVNVIENSRDRYLHSVVCLRGWSAGRLFERLGGLDVSVHSVGKRAGKDFGSYIALRRMFRDLRPDIVHTYNIGTIDAAVCARLAGVRRVIHAEHGRDAADPQGRNAKYRWLRRLLSPMINTFVPVSKDLSRWLADDVGISSQKIRLIYNGIDVDRYGKDEAGSPLPPDFARPSRVVIGSVGRLDPVKAYDVLLESFAKLLERQHELCDCAQPRLVIVGNGPEYAALERQVQQLKIAPFVWLAGERDDVPQLLRAMDIYVCSSVAEGMALTILEAMASGLPVVATRVGGNPELVLENQTGQLVPAADSTALAQTLGDELAQPEQLDKYGAAAQKRARSLFSIAAMISGYCALYDQLLGTTDTAVTR